MPGGAIASDPRAREAPVGEVEVASTDAAQPAARVPSRPAFATAVGWSVVTGVVTTLFVLLSSVLIARTLGPALMGRYSFWMWLVGALPVFCGFGLSQAALKFSAELRGRGEPALAASVLRALLRVEVAVTAAVAAGLLVTGLWSPADALGLYALVALLVVLGGADEILGSGIKGAMDYRFAALRALPLSAVQFALYVAVLRGGGGVAGLLLVIVASSAGAIGFTVWRFRRLYPGGVRPAIPADVRAAIVRYCRSITGLALLDAIVWSRSEVFLLGLLVAPEEIAFYSLAYGVAGRLVMAATLITHPLVPALSALHAERDLARMNRVYSHTIRSCALLTFPLALGGAVFARPLMVLLYTDRYEAAAPALAVIAASSLGGALTLACSAALYGIGRPDFLVRLNVLLAVADVLVAVALIPRLGATGAALANAIGPTVTVVAAGVFLQRRYGLRFPVAATWRVLAAAAAAVGLAWALVPVSGAGSLLAAVAVGGAAYVASTLGFRAVSRAEDAELLDRLGGRLPPGLRRRYRRVVEALP